MYDNSSFQRWHLLIVAVLLACGAMASAESVAVATVCLPGGKLSTSMIDMAIDNRMSYANRWGYEVVMGTERTLPHADKRWEKPALVLKALKTHDWVLWMDCDALVMNWGLSLEELASYASAVKRPFRYDRDAGGFQLPEGSKKDLILSRDINGLNSGVFLVHKTEWSVKFMEQVLGLQRELDEANTVWRDQQAMINLMKEGDHKKHVRFLPQRMMNSYPPHAQDHYQRNYEPGDFIIHQPDCHIYPLCSEQFRMHYHAAIILNDGVMVHLLTPVLIVTVGIVLLFLCLSHRARRRQAAAAKPAVLA